MTKRFKHTELNGNAHKYMDMWYGDGAVSTEQWWDHGFY